MDDAAFLKALQKGTLPKEQMDHRAHLRLAMLCRGEPERARAILLGYVTRVGSGVRFNETLTRFWLRLVAQHPDQDLDGLVELLSDTNLPLRHYSPERLWSDEAQRSLVEPDLRPLP
jgi:hypothetical protein